MSMQSSDDSAQLLHVPGLPIGRYLVEDDAAVDAVEHLTTVDALEGRFPALALHRAVPPRLEGLGAHGPPQSTDTPVVGEHGRLGRGAPGFSRALGHRMSRRLWRRCGPSWASVTDS